LLINSIISATEGIIKRPQTNHDIYILLKKLLAIMGSSAEQISIHSALLERC